MIKNPDLFILNSKLQYPKVLRKGSVTTTSQGQGAVVTLATGVSPSSTWLVAIESEGQGESVPMIVSGNLGRVTPDGQLQVTIERQQIVLFERIHWRIYDI